MTAENFDLVLNGLADRKPFSAFTVALHGGERFAIDGAGALAVRDGVAVLLVPGGTRIWFDHDRVNQIIGAPANAAG